MRHSRLVPKLILALFLVLVGEIVWRFSRSFERNQACCEPPLATNVIFSAMESLGILRFDSQVGQDRWIAESVFPGVTDGYFVDIGSASGVKESNTNVLETLGWRGVCVDPFPHDMEGRHCQTFAKVVGRESGQTVQFRKAGFLGGVQDNLGPWRELAEVKEAEVVDLQTVSLTDILKQANAPTYIQYMSLDIEGAELEALLGFDFSRYKVGAMTIEHNFEEEKRAKIRALLESKGYRLARSLEQDDCYLLEESARTHR